MASVETADQAADNVTKRLKTVPKIDSVEIVESNMIGPQSWVGNSQVIGVHLRPHRWKLAISCR